MYKDSSLLGILTEMFNVQVLFSDIAIVIFLSIHWKSSWIGMYVSFSMPMLLFCCHKPGGGGFINKEKEIGLWISLEFLQSGPFDVLIIVGGVGLCLWGHLAASRGLSLLDASSTSSNSCDRQNRLQTNAPWETKSFPVEEYWYNYTPSTIWKLVGFILIWGHLVNTLKCSLSIGDLVLSKPDGIFGIAVVCVCVCFNLLCLIHVNNQGTKLVSFSTCWKNTV